MNLLNDCDCLELKCRKCMRPVIITEHEVAILRKENRELREEIKQLKLLEAQRPAFTYCDEQFKLDF